MRASLLFIAVVSAFAYAKEIVITVGGNGTEDDASTTFSPQRVEATIGDTVIFNFTSGNHSATQSVFAEPCILAHISNISINGFNSGLRPTNNGTATTILSVPILKENFGQPFWFYDINGCGQGAVGVINSNEDGNETLAGFERNAIRLNGSEADSSSASSGATSGPTKSGFSSPSTATSSAQHIGHVGVIGTLPLLFAALGLTAL